MWVGQAGGVGCGDAVTVAGRPRATRAPQGLLGRRQGRKGSHCFWPLAFTPALRHGHGPGGHNNLQTEPCPCEQEHKRGRTRSRQVKVKSASQSRARTGSATPKRSRLRHQTASVGTVRIRYDTEHVILSGPLRATIHGSVHQCSTATPRQADPPRRSTGCACRRCPRLVSRRVCYYWLQAAGCRADARPAQSTRSVAPASSPKLFQAGGRRTDHSMR